MKTAPRLPREESALVPMLTLVLWLGCASVGVAGFVLPYLRPQPPAPVPPPVLAEFVKVELTGAPPPPANPAPALTELSKPPPLDRPPALPPPPELIPVAAPSPRIAFAVPVVAPARVVPVAQAAFRTEVTPSAVETTAAPPAPQQLTFGQGEGRQPLPEYPREALRAGQEGTVTLRLTANEQGRVMAAEVHESSSWPLLDLAALRAAKSRWRFTPGPVRAYEVAIRFQLNK